MSAPAPRWYPAYVGIGSNLDSPQRQILQAITSLRSLPNTIVTGASSLYRSAPMGTVEQADFVNAVAAILTTISPHEFLSKLRTIEDQQGRRRDGARWGPRTLDLDILLFGDHVIDDSILTIPHPGISQRNFVLLPLCELAPHLIVPGLGTVAELTEIAMATGDRIEKIAGPST